jgi:hypothetical protein
VVDGLREGPPESVGRDTRIAEDLAGDSGVVREGDDEVLGADPVVARPDRLVARLDDRATGGGGEALEHGQFLPVIDEPRAVLLVNRLPGDPEHASDVLP